jgi:hypothetical protein
MSGILDIFDFGKHAVEAHQLGNALRVGNEPDVGDKLRQALYEPDARAIILNADRIATQHAPGDVHGPNGMGVERLSINNNGTIDLINNETGSARYIANLGDPGSVRI